MNTINNGVLSINNPYFENYLGQMYPPELEIKDTTESNTYAYYLDSLLSIGREVNFALPLTTNVTISISILQTFRSWVATSRLWRFYLTTYPMRQGLHLLWMFNSEGGATIPKLIGQWYVKKRLKSSLRQFYGRYGDLNK